jgi:DedD protein
MSSDVRTARHGAEDGFHEIQLSGKQLVFLFMATTTVSIVIFLCGVLVGRGARPDAPPPDVVEAAAAQEPGAPPASAAEPVVDSTAPAAGPEPSQPTKVESSDFNYMQMLTAEQSTGEVPQPVAEPAGDAGAASAPPPPALQEAVAAASPPPADVAAAPSSAPAPAAAAARAAAAPPATTPAAGALTIQVAAFKSRGEADAVAKRLRTRGYEAYVADPATGNPMYRVRVGHFGERAEADKVASRLAKEEKFRPWVTR